MGQKQKVYWILLLFFYFGVVPIQADQISTEKDRAKFAVIYRSYVKPDCENRYQEYWGKVATYFVKERGALGSTLHKTEDGMWVAYSRWPSKAARDASWPQGKDSINPGFPSHIREAIEGLKSCLDEERRLPEICMEIIQEVSAI